MSGGPQTGAGWSHQHRDVSGGKLRPIVFGAVDGLVTNGSLIAGVGGSGLRRTALILTGLAGLAGALSMATGKYIGSRARVPHEDTPCLTGRRLTS